MNGSGLHSHTTAEVFIIHSGAWRFYWGVDGTEGEVILKKGDIASFPTNMFRGFQNVSKEEALMFVVLGENDPGVITWTPKLLKDAKKTKMSNITVEGADLALEIGAKVKKDFLIK